MSTPPPHGLTVWLAVRVPLGDEDGVPVDVDDCEGVGDNVWLAVCEHDGRLFQQ
jgi:hypothetical protein